MRFRRIHIPAYGPFTGLDLSFDTKGPDFHLIFGSNEAGKSSLLRSFRSLLYGIPTRTSDTFIHKAGDLRLTAELEAKGGESLFFQRRKRQ